MESATHVWVLKPKPTPLGERYDGPYPIVRREGSTCLVVRVGYLPNGEERTELVHWDNCKVAYFMDEPIEAERPRRGRKPIERFQEMTSEVSPRRQTGRQKMTKTISPTNNGVSPQNAPVMDAPAYNTRNRSAFVN